jgi:hypothetical protein
MKIEAPPKIVEERPSSEPRQYSAILSESPDGQESELKELSVWITKLWLRLLEV